MEVVSVLRTQCFCVTILLVRLIINFIKFLGKSTLLSVLGNREVPIPEQIDIFHLTREMPASEKSALQCVMEVDQERIRLEKLVDELVACPDDGMFLF